MMRKLPTDQREVGIVGAEIALQLSRWYEARVAEMQRRYPGETQERLEQLVILPSIGYLTGMAVQSKVPREELIQYVKTANNN